MIWTRETSITVYQRHIDGANVSGHFNPIARAVSERFSKRGEPPRWAFWFWNWVQIDISPEEKFLKVPHFVNLRGQEYIQKGTMEPFSFNLSGPIYNREELEHEKGQK